MSTSDTSSTVNMRIWFDGKKRVMLQSTDTLICIGRNGNTKYIPPGRWWINRNTPVGEDAELWERMPHGGKRLIEWNKLMAVDRKIHKDT